MAQRPSTISRLPAEIREQIGRLREAGRTIDEIMDHLRRLDVDVSRSAVGRHVQGLAKLGEKLRRSRAMAEGLARELGDAPESRVAKVNIELLHEAILTLHENADGEETDEGGKAALAGNPMGLMLLSKSIEHLTKASRHNADYVAQVEARAAARERQKNVEAAEAVARERGLGADTIAAIKASILGVERAA